ncbi:MAG: hypothetical protein HYU64_13175 [Armatimonadetes bacterium]|nr:hypothetical protein [Armatimonadota bacterium]
MTVGAVSLTETTRARGAQALADSRKGALVAAGEKLLKDKKVEEQSAKDVSWMPGLGLGSALTYAETATGLETALHESGHLLTAEALYRELSGSVQVDGFENLSQLAKRPSTTNLTHFLLAHDARQDGASGYFSYTAGEPSALGRIVGARGREALVAVSGPAIAEGAQMAAFAIGFKLRKKHPILGYTLMASAAMNHVSNSLYPINAAMSAGKPAGETSGNDFLQFSRATGIPPALTAAVFAVSLPALGAALFWMERQKEEDRDDRIALAGLLSKGKVPDETLDKLVDAYPRKENLLRLERRLGELLKTPLPKPDRAYKDEILLTTRKLGKEYVILARHLVVSLRPQVDEEKKEQGFAKKPLSLKGIFKDVSEEIAKEYKRDKVGTILSTSATAATLALVTKNTADAVLNVAGGSSGGTLPPLSKVLAPAVGVLAAAATGYRAYQAFKDPGATTADKAGAAAVAGFASIGALGTVVPGWGVPLGLVSLGGILLTSGYSWYVNRPES